MEQNYDDIINRPHPISKIHPRMKPIDRAAQFSPFAALTGYDAAVKETARLTDQRVELDEYEKIELNRKLQQLRNTSEIDENVTITYFVPDDRKDGGSYVTVVGCVKKFDDYEHQIILKDGRRILVSEIIEVDN